ncbi:MobF family relaxase [Amycolatopsis sp. cmx-4-54]|uniref:MobF family relaxase n=1 Tax=Amycolatopsis sp. cmx-4-54 TaxID=2790936 RepID=UPI00397B35ED
MAWITPIGSDPAQIDYRLGIGHGCLGEAITDAQFADHLDLREEPLVWVGKGLADLGITAGTELTPDQFHKARALVNGYHPTTGEQLVAHKKGVPHEAKLAVAPLIRMIEGVAREADVPLNQVLVTARMRTMFARAKRSLRRQGERAALRADHAGQLADAAELAPADIWGEDVFTTAFSNLTRTITLPDGSQQHIDNRIVVGNVAYDATLTLPGSFTALLGLLKSVDPGTHAELTAIYTDQAMATFNWVEDAVAYGMRGHHGDGQTADVTPGNGFAGWAMFHRTARPVGDAPVGDPHWHVHYTIANMTKGEDGKWSTIAAGGRDLMRHAPVVDKLLQASVRNVLSSRYGMEFRRSERTGLWEIAAVPDEAIALFSKRGEGIEAALVEMGLSPDDATAAVRRVAAGMTRERKNDSAAASDQTLAEYWRDEAIAAGLDPDQIVRAPFAAGESTSEATRIPSLEELAAQLQNPETGVTAHGRRFSRLDAIIAVAEALPAGGTQADIEQLADHVLEQAGFVQLGDTGQPGAPVGTDVVPTNGERRQLGAEHMANATLYTTDDVIAAERVIVAKAETSAPDETSIRVGRETAELAATTIEASGGFELSSEQWRQLLRITTSGAGLDTLVGPPGSGKTTLMDAVRAAYEAEGFVIAGTATQGVTAQTLQAESGIPSRTITQWLWRIENGPGLRGIDVLVLDEAGMIDDRARARLYLAATASGTKILEIGDPKQLRGVGIGSSFAVIHALVGGGELKENRRQVDADERAAIAAWRRGDYSEALTSWADRDRLIATETGNESIAAMLATWLDQRQGAPDPLTEQRGLLMVAATNDMVDRLNDGAQALRAVAGELGETRAYDISGGRTAIFSEGDHVMVRVNERRLGEPDVLNGYRGVIDTIYQDGSIAVHWERATRGGRVVEHADLSPAFIAKGGLTLGYAITIHKGQGLTVGSDGATWTGPDGQRRGGAVLFSATGADNPGTFVAATRHKLAVWMFLARKELETAHDVYLLGFPRKVWDRTQRVITKVISRAEATEFNRNDIPALVDLGLLDVPTSARRTTEPALPDPTAKTPEEIEQHRALRARVHAEDVVRRVKAERLLREEWEDHPAVDRVVHGTAFRALALTLDRADKAGRNPRDLIRDINPDNLINPEVHDPSRLTASLVKASAQADPATTQPRPRPLTKAQRQARADAIEQAQRDIAATLLRQEWAEHPAVDRVITGTAFSAVARNLAKAARAGHDPRAIVRDLDPDYLLRPRIDNPSVYAASRIRAAITPQEAAHPSPTDRPRPVALPPRHPDAPARLDHLIPAYQNTLEHLTGQPAPVPAAGPASPKPARPHQPPATRNRDAMWPSWIPGPPDRVPRTGREKSLAAAVATDARRIRARVVKLGREAVRDRPEWVEQLGPPPDGAAQRARYLAAVTTIAAYREQHSITGPDPLGPAPAEGEPRAAHNAATQARDSLIPTIEPRIGQPKTSTAPDLAVGKHQDRTAADPRQGRPSQASETAARAERITDHQRQPRPRLPLQDEPRRPAPGQSPRPGL